MSENAPKWWEFWRLPPVDEQTMAMARELARKSEGDAARGRVADEQLPPLICALTYFFAVVGLAMSLFVPSDSALAAASPSAAVCWALILLAFGVQQLAAMRRMARNDLAERRGASRNETKS